VVGMRENTLDAGGGGGGLLYRTRNMRIQRGRTRGGRSDCGGGRGVVPVAGSGKGQSPEHMLSRNSVLSGYFFRSLKSESIAPRGS